MAYLYSSPFGTRLSHTSVARAAQQPALGTTSLPTTGGGSGGSNPTSPLAPLALLAAVAIVVGRMLPRILKK